MPSTRSILLCGALLAACNGKGESPSKSATCEATFTPVVHQAATPADPPASITLGQDSAQLAALDLSGDGQDDLLYLSDPPVLYLGDRALAV